MLNLFHSRFSKFGKFNCIFITSRYIVFLFQFMEIVVTVQIRICDLDNYHFKIPIIHAAGIHVNNAWWGRSGLFTFCYFSDSVA